LLTLVPEHETLRAEVWVTNEDIGFVKKGQTVRLKFAAFPFQKYGMVQGMVAHIGADSVDATTANGTAPNEAPAAMPASRYKALVALKVARLEADGERFPLSAGMQANAEILLGTRTVLEYLLSPVQKAWHEAGRER
jgi:HlyD family secretion protein